MQDTNWELIQFKYEFLGFSLKDLAREHSISLAVLEYNSKDWKPISLEQCDPVNMDSIKSIDDVLDKLSTQTLNQTQALSILKQKFLGSKYVEFETILLFKAIAIASNLAENETKSATTLRALTDILVNLLGQNPLLQSGEIANREGDKVWEIKIVEAKAKPSETDE